MQGFLGDGKQVRVYNVALKARHVNYKLLAKWEVRSSSVVFKCEPVCMYINIMCIEDCGMGCASNSLGSAYDYHQYLQSLE